MSNAIKLHNVMSVYVGRAGACCCGCSGKHSYASQHRLTASQHRGYTIADSEVSDLAVKRAYGRLLRAADLHIEPDHMYAEERGRVVVAYFVPQS